MKQLSRYSVGMANKSVLDAPTLRAALIGYEHQISELKAKAAEVQRQLSGRVTKGSSPPASSDAAQGTRRKMSATARKRIAAAQKKRWAAFHAAKQKPAKPAKPAQASAKKSGGKRKMSAAGRKRIAEATKKRWADLRAAKAAALATIP